MTDPELDFWELRPMSTALVSSRAPHTVAARSLYAASTFTMNKCSRFCSLFLVLEDLPSILHAMIYSHTPGSANRHRSHNTVDSWQTNTLLAPVEICSHPALASIRDTGPLAVSAQLSHHDGQLLSHSVYRHQHAGFQRDLQSLTVLLQNSSASVG